MADRERQDEIQMDASSLCREEIYTDRRFGTIRVLVPVDANGDDDPKRATVYAGEGADPAYAVEPPEADGGRAGERILVFRTDRRTGRIVEVQLLPPA